MAAASGGGIPFDPRDPSTLATAVVRLLECSTEERARMSARLRLYYAAHFDAKVLFDRYRGIVLPGPGRRRQAA
jgi:glycosyltransferase involved in cell wall biosynthesis